MYAFVFQNDLYKVDDILMSELTTKLFHISSSHLLPTCNSGVNELYSQPSL